MASLKKLQKYEIKFYDHLISNDDKEIVCTVLGYYLESDKNYHHFTWWIIDTKDQELFDNNIERYSILKTAIISTKKLTS